MESVGNHTHITVDESGETMKEKTDAPEMKYLFRMLYQKHLKLSDRWHYLCFYQEVFLHIYLTVCALKELLTCYNNILL